MIHTYLRSVGSAGLFAGRASFHPKQHSSDNADHVKSSRSRRQNACHLTLGLARSDCGECVERLWGDCGEVEEILEDGNGEDLTPKCITPHHEDLCTSPWAVISEASASFHAD